jgi:hypothetical protein
MGSGVGDPWSPTPDRCLRGAYQASLRIGRILVEESVDVDLVDAGKRARWKCCE